MLGVRARLMGCRWLVAAAVAVFVVSEGAAQQGVSCHPMAEMTGVVAPEKLPVPEKMTGIGNGYMDITANAEAKAWFEQGLNLLHDFWDYEAARAFEQGIRVDPKCAMCYWGLAKAEGFRGATAPGVDAALKQASDLAKNKKNTTKAEWLYIKAAVVGHKDQAVRSGQGPNSGGAAGT